MSYRGGGQKWVNFLHYGPLPRTRKQRGGEKDNKERRERADVSGVFHTEMAMMKKGKEPKELKERSTQSADQSPSNLLCSLVEKGGNMYICIYI